MAQEMDLQQRSFKYLGNITPNDASGFDRELLAKVCNSSPWLKKVARTWAINDQIAEITLFDTSKVDILLQIVNRNKVVGSMLGNIERIADCREPKRFGCVSMQQPNECEIMKTITESKVQTNVAVRIAGEDIKPGDFVTVLNEIIELPSFLWACSGSALPADEPVRTRYMPREVGQPFKVIAVCLPFVYAKRPQGKIAAFDTRQQQLVRLDSKSGRSIWKQMRSAAKSVKS
jgi:hypothetical protein